MVSKNQLVKNIWTTICFYDALNYPLTSFEIWKLLINEKSLSSSKKFNVKESQFSLDEIEDALLENSFLKSKIKSQKGFYFLKGREYLIWQRLQKEKISGQKIKRLKRIIKFLRWIPFLRAILITGRLASKTADEKSDWDILVITQAGRIWTARTGITLITELIGKRRKGKKIKDRICLNYFITERSLTISVQDLFASHEYFFAIPLFDTGDVFFRFRKNNIWIKKIRPHYFLENNSSFCLKDDYLSKFLRNKLEFLINFLQGDKIEKWLSQWQTKKIKKNPLTHLKGSLIRASSSELVFLPRPAGPRIFEKFKKIKKEAFF